MIIAEINVIKIGTKTPGIRKYVAKTIDELRKLVTFKSVYISFFAEKLGNILDH